MKRGLLPVVVLGCLVLGGHQALAVTLEIVPSSLQGPLGTTREAEIRISGAGDLTAPSVATFDLEVIFDTTVLSFGSAIYGDPALGDQLDLLGLGSITQTTLGVDVVNLFELSLDSPDDLNQLQRGDFTLVTLTFDVIGAGVGRLRLEPRVLGDAAGRALAVPEPATVLLLASSVAGLAGRSLWSRRRRLDASTWLVSGG